MLAKERQMWIQNKVLREGRAYIAELAAELGVTGETIRRDIRVLARDKRIVKTHGGAMLNQDLEKDWSLSQRLQQQSEAKKRIGNFAMTMIQDSDVIYFPSIGACVWAVANLRDVRDLVVVTGSLDIASIVSSNLESGEITGKLILLGGEVIPKQKTTRITTALDMLRSIYFTKIFLGASALSEEGPLLYNLDSCETNRMLIQQTEKVFVLAESAKFLKTSLFRYTGFDGVDCFITDDAYPIPPGAIKNLEENQVQVFRIGENCRPIECAR